MLYRSAVILIVVFWIAMTALLFRKEFSPGASALTEVAASHVLKWMFQHGEPSDLNVYNDRQMAGQLRIHPQIRKEDGARLLEFSGRLLLALPGAARQRVSWAGEIEWNKVLEMESARVQLFLSEPAIYGVNILVDPATRRLRYETQLDGRTLNRGEYPLTADGAYTWLREQGIDPALIQGNITPNAPKPTISAWQSSLMIHGQKLDTYRVVIEHGGQTLIEFHVNQIGQILQVKTFLGYTAAPEDIVP
jgi:hypothetical protein